MMGTEATVTLVDAPDALAQSCIELGHTLDAEWSRFKPDSEISRLNAGETVSASLHTQRLIDQMRRAVALTEGAFDPTLLREVIDLGYATSLAGTGTTIRPTTPRGDASLADVITVDGNVSLPRGLTLDSGGIGKGFAADLIIEFALANGAAGAMANVGGDVACAGQAPDGNSWRIAVEDPFNPDDSLGMVRLSAGAIATSSQLKRRFSTLKGDWSHLINPKTRHAVETEVQSVTVIAGEGWLAEAAAKPGFVWPLLEYLEWAPTVNTAALVVMADHSIHTTRNWGEYA